LDEGQDKQTIVVFDHHFQDLPIDEVYLFNTRENKILIYKKDIVRPKLSPLKNRSSSELKAIEFAFTKAKVKLRAELYDLEREFPPSFYNNYDPYVSIEEINEQIDVAEERSMYSNLMKNSNEEGWFYPDHDANLIDNIVGSS